MENKRQTGKELWGLLFKNMSPQQIAAAINEKYLGREYKVVLMPQFPSQTATP